jgi:uncharacterized protein
MQPDVIATQEAVREKFGGTSIRAVSGTYVDYLNPNPNDIVLGDIIRGVSRAPRYIGHTSTDSAWTVADHLVLCVKLARQFHPKMPPEFYAAVFLHDAHEAYMSDLPSPLKQALKVLGGYEAISKIEQNLDRAIHTKFGITYPLPDGWKKLIKDIDLLSFRIEESNFRPQPTEKNFMPAGVPLSALPKPLESDMGRTLRTLDCWQEIMADRVLAAAPKLETTIAVRAHNSPSFSAC